MKKFTLSMLGLAFSGMALAQSPVLTISSSAPVVSVQGSLGLASTFGVASPAQGANMNWNYSSLVSTMNLNASYTPATNPLIPLSNLVLADQFAELVPGYGYDYSSLYNYAAGGNGFVEVGRLVPAQSYSMLPVTGIATDSLTIPTQAVSFSSMATILPPAATYTDYWQSVYQFNLDALVDISAFGLMNVPTQKRSHVISQDSVVGWGTMVVPAQGGASIPYPVLMVKRMQITTDSLFMNGSPAPAAMLAALNQTQGQVTRSNSYAFYRQGSIIPLAEFRYGSTPFSQLSEVVFDRSSTVQVNGLASEVAQIPVQLYPNPTSGNQLNIRFEKTTAASWVFGLTDLAGRAVYRVQISGDAPEAQQKITLPAHVSNGLYMWQLTDEKGNLKSAGKVSVAR